MGVDAARGVATTLFGVISSSSGAAGNLARRRFMNAPLFYVIRGEIYDVTTPRTPPNQRGNVETKYFSFPPRNCYEIVFVSQ